jgi:hypothetical protein
MKAAMYQKIDPLTIADNLQVGDCIFQIIEDKYKIVSMTEDYVILASMETGISHFKMLPLFALLDDNWQCEKPAMMSLSEQ